MDNDYKGVPIKSFNPPQPCKKYYREELTNKDRIYLQNILDVLRDNGKGDPIKSGLVIGYVGINGMKRLNQQVLFAGSPEQLIDRVLDIYNLCGVRVGCSLYAQNIPIGPIAELRDGYFRLV